MKIYCINITDNADEIMKNPNEERITENYLSFYSRHKTCNSVIVFVDELELEFQFQFNRKKKIDTKKKELLCIIDCRNYAASQIFYSRFRQNRVLVKHNFEC